MHDCAIHGAAVPLADLDARRLDLAHGVLSSWAGPGALLRRPAASSPRHTTLPSLACPAPAQRSLLATAPPPRPGRAAAERCTGPCATSAAHTLETIERHSDRRRGLLASERQAWNRGGDRGIGRRAQAAHGRTSRPQRAHRVSSLSGSAAGNGRTQRHAGAWWRSSNRAMRFRSASSRRDPALKSRSDRSSSRRSSSANAICTTAVIATTRPSLRAAVQPDDSAATARAPRRRARSRRPAPHPNSTGTSRRRTPTLRGRERAPHRSPRSSSPGRSRHTPEVAGI